jgi:DNA-binding NarL/FixJ family response regulator
MSATGHPDPAAALVGRERELATLREALAAAQAGRGSLVLIGGEAGIGKTALAEALLAEAQAQGALVLVGHCYDLSETPPYGPWAEALAGAPRDAAFPALPAAVLAADREGEALPGQDAIMARVRGYLIALAATQPVVLLLDDLHWADAASLDLLRLIARQLADRPCLLVATYRTDELTRRHPLATLLPLLVREAHAARLAPRPLDEAALLTLVRGRYALPDADEARLVAYLAGRAEGNPFFSGELLRALEEAGTLHPGPGDGLPLGDLDAVPVPPLLRQVINARVDRLGEEAGRLLAIAAVVGPLASPELWAAVAGATEEALLGVIERAIEARLLVERPGQGGYRFAHALIREALYDGLALPRRRLWHRQAAEALLASPAPDPEPVAHHFRQAGDPRAATWLLRAGERAFRAYALESAVERLETALPELEAAGADAGERAWLLYRLARILRSLNPGRGLRYLAEAARLADAAGERALAAYIQFDRGLLGAAVTAEHHRVMADMAEGIAALDALPVAARVVRGGHEDAWLADALPAGRQARDAAALNIRRGTLALWLSVFGRYAEARTLGERTLVETVDLLPQNIFALISTADAAFGLGNVHTAEGRPVAARAALEQAGRLNLAAGHHLLVTAALRSILIDVTLVYAADDLHGRVQQVEQIEQSVRHVAEDDTPPVHHVPLHYLAGRWAEARGVYAQQRAYADDFATWIGLIDHAQGDTAAAWHTIRATLPAGPATAPGAGAFLACQALQRLAAALALGAGDLPLARDWLAAHDRWLAWSSATLGLAEGQLGWATYHRAAGDHVAARAAADRALAHASEPRQPLALLAAHRLLGELATEARSLAEAQAHLDVALALAEACAAPYERALTLLALAALHTASSDRAAAATTLAEARAILVPLEATPALGRAEALEARLLAAPASSPAALPFGLTAREAEVLRLLAEGLPDAQIAARLFLSRNTVNSHTKVIYGKLGVTSRAAAGRRATEHGLA